MVWAKKLPPPVGYRVNPFLPELKASLGKCQASFRFNECYVPYFIRLNVKQMQFPMAERFA